MAPPRDCLAHIATHGRVKSAAETTGHPTPATLPALVIPIAHSTHAKGVASRCASRPLFDCGTISEALLRGTPGSIVTAIPSIDSAEAELRATLKTEWWARLGIKFLIRPCTDRRSTGRLSHFTN